MTRPTMLIAGGALATLAALAGAGFATASSPSHHHRAHHPDHGHARVGDDIYSNREPGRYGPDYGVVGGLVWNIEHLL